MNNHFQDIDLEITNFSNEIRAIAKELVFQEVCEFKPGESLCPESWNLLACPGVYLIEIKTEGGFEDFRSWVENFKLSWEKSEYIYEYVPNLKKKRIGKHTDLKTWMPIYIGKSKWIGQRIKEHLYLDLKRHAFALKLSSRSNLTQHTFRVQIINIPVKNYDWIVPLVESTLREKYNPIIGRQ